MEFLKRRRTQVTSKGYSRLFWIEYRVFLIFDILESNIEYQEYLINEIVEENVSRQEWVCQIYCKCTEVPTNLCTTKTNRVFFKFLVLEIAGEKLTTSWFCSIKSQNREKRVLYVLYKVLMLNMVVFCMPPPALPPLSICWAKSLPERNLLEENRLPKDFNALQKSRNCHHHQLVYLLSICQANILFMSRLSSANQHQNQDLVLCRWRSIFECSPVWRIVTDRSAVTEKRWSIRKYHICHHFNFLLLVLPFSQYILAMYHDSLVKLLCAHGNHGRSERVVEGVGRVGGSSWRGVGGRGGIIPHVSSPSLPLPHWIAIAHVKLIWSNNF